MASRGIKDQVAIVGMGCTPFGEHWDKSVDDMLVEASQAAYASAGIEQDDIDAYWFGTLGSGVSGLTLSRALKIDYKPVTRVENMCATGSEAFRNACYAVACGAYDVVAAIGVEKLKDNGMSGLTGAVLPNDGTKPELTAPAMFSLLAPAYSNKYGVDETEMKDVLTRIAWKNHYNGARNPRAQFQKEVSKDKIRNAPLIAGQLGIFDCSGVSDGSAAAIIVRAEDAYKYTDKPLFVKALAFAAGPAAGPIDPDYDYTTFNEVVACVEDAYAQAGVEHPRAEIAMAEVHDCFTPTELVLMEDLGFADRGLGMEGGDGRDLRPRRRAPHQSRWRTQELRTPHRRFGTPHVVRVLATAATGGARRSTDQECHRGRQDPRDDPQSRRCAGGVCQLREHRGFRTRLSIGLRTPAATCECEAPTPIGVVSRRGGSVVRRGP